MAFVIMGIAEARPSSFAGGFEDTTGVDSLIGSASSSFLSVRGISSLEASTEAVVSLGRLCSLPATITSVAEIT